MGKKRSYLHEIKISGYKSISTSNPQSVRLDDINVIIGANGTGKSNFISFFKMLNYMMTGTLQKFVGENGSSNNILHLGAKKTPVLSASLTFKNIDDTDVYNFSLVKTVQDSLIFSEESIEWNKRRFDLSGGQKESYLLSGEATHMSEKIVKQILSKCRTFQFHDTSSAAFIRNAGPLVNNKYLFSDAGNIAAFLFLLKNKDSYRSYYKRIVQFVQSIMPQFEDFELTPEPLNESYIKLNWKQKNNPDYIFGPEQLSDGTIRFIALSTLFLQPPELMPNVIIIDEPELGLHPQAIDALCSMIRMASRNSQIILATQSERIVDNFDPSQIIVAEIDEKDRVSTYKRLNSKELVDWLKEYSLSEIWEKNIIGGLPL